MRMETRMTKTRIMITAEDKKNMIKPPRIPGGFML